MSKINTLMNIFRTNNNDRKNTAKKSLLTAFTNCHSRTVKRQEHNVTSAFPLKKLAVPTKKISSCTVRKQTPDSKNYLHRAPVSPQTSSKTNPIYQRYEKASQGLSDLHSIQSFKKDILMGYSAGSLNDSQYSTLSGKVTASVFKLVRQGNIQNLSMTILTPLVGKDKAKEIMNNVDTQLKTKLNTLQWGATQNSQKLHESLSQKGKNLNTVPDAINFKREVLSRVSAKELSLEKAKDLLQSCLPSALNKLAQKPDSAKQLNPSLLKNLVSSQQAQKISTTCNMTLQKNDQAIMAQMETAPLPPTTPEK